MCYPESHTTVLTTGSYTTLRTRSFYDGDPTLLNDAFNVVTNINKSSVH